MAKLTSETYEYLVELLDKTFEGMDTDKDTPEINDHKKKIADIIDELSAVGTY